MLTRSPENWLASILKGGSGLLMLVALGCSPKNEEVHTAQVNPAAPAATTDSLNNPDKDGTATEQTNQKPELLLPQPVLQLLARQYPDWREPELLNTPEQQDAEKDQGPLLIRGDFTGNNLQDMALQIRDNRDVVVVALLQDSAAWQLHELKRDILFNDRSAFKSLYYVYLTPAGSTVAEQKTGNELTTQTDAITVGTDNNALTYLYEDGSFKPYRAATR